MDTPQETSIIMQLALMLAAMHGPVTTIAVLVTTGYLAAFHVLRYTSSLSLSSRSNTIILACLLILLGEITTRYLARSQTNPDFQRNILTDTEGTLAALAIIAGWTAAVGWDKPRLHITAWTLAAALSTALAAMTGAGQAHNFIIVFSMLMATAHLAATNLEDVKACALHGYSTAEIGVLRGMDIAWVFFCLISLF